MSEKENISIARMCAITISREYGSGGGEIASRLAKRLGWQLIDHEVITRIAQEIGVSEAEAEAFDEHIGSLMSRILHTMQTVDPGMMPVLPPLPEMSVRDYREALHKIMQAAVEQRHVVIVGRGSQAILANQRDVLHIRVVAPPALRTRYVMQREGLNQADAEERIRFKDSGRYRYVQMEHHVHPDDAHLYDLVINTGILDLESAIDLICLALQSKARQLSLPPETLGPGAGLTPYPGQPLDFRPPEPTQI